MPPPFVSGNLPVYPPLAQTARIQGEVRLRVSTDGDGARDVHVLTGSPMLNDAARESILTWRFAPHPPTTFDVTVRFGLRQPDCNARPPLPLTFRLTEVEVLAYFGLQCDPIRPIGGDVLPPVLPSTAEVRATATRVSADAALADLKEWRFWCTDENARRPLIRVEGLVVEIVERRPGNCGNLRVSAPSASLREK